jgi:spectinomycin phosphotransferase
LYRVNTDNEKYFLKVKKGEIYEPSVTVPRYLKDTGITQVVAPIPTKSGELWEKADNFILILYPFIDGETGMKVGMSENQWIEFGAVLKKIHSSKLSSGLASQVKKENFSPKWSGLIKELQTKIDNSQFTDSLQKELASFWKEKNEEIRAIINRMEELGHLLRTQPLDFVLCHTDIHTANILLDKQNKMFIVDWDNPLLAPKERDLMFIVGAKEEQRFFNGYGKSDINSVALAYYRYEWVAQEIGDYGERVFLNNDVGEETKKDAVKSFIELFQPDDVVESAYKSDPEKINKEFAAKE